MTVVKPILIRFKLFALAYMRQASWHLSLRTWVGLLAHGASVGLLHIWQGLLLSGQITWSLLRCYCVLRWGDRLLIEVLASYPICVLLASI